MTEIAQSSFTEENELLLLCARTQVSQEHLQKITRLTQEKLDWVYLLATAAQHGILPLLFRNLSTCYEVIPPRYLAQLRIFFMTNSVRNEFLAKELTALLGDFKSESIATLPFKGPALAVMAYGDLSLREFIDLDILVPQSQLTQAFQVMKEKGFLLKGIGPEENQTPSSTKKTYTFIRGVGLTEIRVDLQSLIIGDYFAAHINDHSIWDRVTKIPLAGKLVPSLGAEDLLLTLCIHGSKHFWEKTKWICDVAELIQRHEKKINWRLVSEQADRLGGRKMLELGLKMAHHLQDPNHSGDALIQKPFHGLKATDPLMSATALWLSDRLFRQLEPNQQIRERKVFYLHLRDNLSGKFRNYVYLCLVPFPQKYWCLLPHPRLFSFIYFFVFLIRKGGKYGLPQNLKGSIERWLKLVEE